MVIPVSDRFIDYGRRVFEILKKSGLRVDIDTEDAKLGYKIRKAELEKVPYMVIVGGKEVETDMVSVRSKRDGDLGQMGIFELVEKLKDEIEKKI